MTIHLVSHPACLEHDAGRGHPERPERLSAVLDALSGPEWERRLERHEAPAALREQLLRVHPESHLRVLERIHAEGGGRLDPDTAMNASSLSAALRAAGGSASAARLAAETGRNAFAAVRPPGHHAESVRPMGFCLLNNVVVAAREALTIPGVELVLIVDWDVHHGNGTQELVADHPNIRYVSIHQWPYYPGTGAHSERGVGNIFNVPMPAGLEPEEYVEGLMAGIETAITDFVPDLILVSAGFDAMAGDPLAGFSLRGSDYRTFTRRLLETRAPLAGVLEGGYDLSNLAEGVTAFLEELV